MSYNEFMSLENQHKIRERLTTYLKNNPEHTYVYRDIGISRPTFYSFLVNQRHARRPVIARIDSFLNQKGI